MSVTASEGFGDFADVAFILAYSESCVYMSKNVKKYMLHIIFIINITITAISWLAGIINRHLMLKIIFDLMV
jgi:hypothetical protein